MRFLMFLMVFAVMVSFSAFCQELTDSQLLLVDSPPNPGDAVRSADINSQNPKQQDGSCACSGKNKTQSKCPCKNQRHSRVLWPAWKAQYKNKGSSPYKKCKKHKSKLVSTPI